MAKGASKLGGGTSTTSSGGTTSVSNVPTNASAMTDNQADALRKQQDSTYDANTTAAVKMYISDTNFDGQGHSLSQTLNYLEGKGVDINNADLKTINKQYGLNLSARDLASMQYTSNIMDVAAHPIGQDTILHRGSHDELITSLLGGKDYSTMTEKQLKKDLIGKTYNNNTNLSTSYDLKKNPFLDPSSPVSGGRELVTEMKVGSNTKVLFGAKKQAEVIVGKNQNFVVTDVEFTGKTATPRNGLSKPQVKLYVETY